MAWNSDSENEEFNDKPYSTFSHEDPQRFLTRPKYPFVFLGAGLLLLIALVIVFFPRSSGQKNEVSGDTNEVSGDTNEVSGDITARVGRIETKVADLMDIHQRIDGLESRIVEIENKVQSAREGQAAPNPELTDQIKSNRKLIKDTSKRLNLIEERLNRVGKQIQEADAAESDRQTTGPSSSETFVYVVKKGDTPYGISREHDVELDRLLKINGLDDNAEIYPGQELEIPKR